MLWHRCLKVTSLIPYANDSTIFIKIDIKDLIDVIARSVEELLLLHTISVNNLAFQIKQKELELIQEVIVHKRTHVNKLKLIQ